MVSTFIEYNLITRDLKASLKNTADQTLVARDTAYYKEHIGDVKTVDDFLGDYRLYSYAMKAHGLEDMTYAKAFMRKVLESDLSDDNSYANQLTDDRYRDFARAFSFSQATEVVQSNAQEDAVIGLYNQSIQNQDDSVKSDSRYFNIVIDTVKKVDDIWGNQQLKDYVFTAFDLNPGMSYDHFKAVVTSDVNDPNSYVNTSMANYRDGLQAKIDYIRGTASAADLADSKSNASKLITQYQTAIQNAPDETVLAAAFNFQADGTIASGDKAMSDAQKASTNEAYVFQQPRTSSSLAALNKLYFESTIGSVDAVSDITGNSRIFQYVKTAFGLPSGFLTSTFENIVTSDLNDPASYANTQGGTQYGATYKALAAAFNFQSDGTVAPGNTAQTSAQKLAISQRYLVTYNDADDAADATLISSYKALMGTVTTVDDFLGDKKIMSLVLQAFDLQDQGDTTRKLKMVMTSDLNDPKSYANTLKDKRYTDMAKAFNFNSDGTLGSPTLAQSESEILNTAKSYVVEKSRFGTEDDRTKATTEASYYSAEIEKIGSLDDFLSNRRLVDFTLTAAGIDPKDVTTDTMRKMFDSDLDDPDSFVNTEADTRYRSIVASFNFNLDGQIERPKEAQIQTRRGMLETEDMYLNQTLEESEGEDNAGVRLALYFRRNAPNIGSAYDILADSALLQVVQTAFSIPSETSSVSVDLQYAYINRVLNVEDLQDPEKLEKLMARFTSLYDLDNNTDTSAAELILSGNGGGGISADTLFTLSQLRIGGN